MANGVGIECIGQIAIAVKDLDRAVDFYENTLELKLLFQAPPVWRFSIAAGFV